MIVNMHEEGWEIIYHRAHALLAAELGARWRERPVRYIETIAAIAQHDDIEREWEGNELTDAGAPLDFTLSKESPGLSLIKYRKLLEGAFYRSRWVGYLTSKHIQWLTNGMRGASGEWNYFLDEIEKLQNRVLSDLAITPVEGQRAYDFMHWCDRLSLILTRREIPEAGRALEIISIGDTRYELRSTPEDGVTVTPWCFKEPSFEITTEAAYLSQLHYSSNEELRQALRSAPIRELRWRFHEYSK